MEEKPKSKDDFYAIVSAIARFIETADNDIAPSNKKTDISVSFENEVRASRKSP